ncbi:MAG: ketopantoate reductase family protein [Hyphomicrobium sp.]
MKIAIIGAGAIGGYIGSCLVKSGADVIFIARGQRLKQLLEQGLCIKSPLGDCSMPVVAREYPDENFAPQIVVLACRAPALESALTSVQSCIEENTRVLPFLNGVKHIKTLQNYFPRAHILGGIAHGAVTLQQDGLIQHLSPFFKVIVGSTSSSSDPIVESLIASLTSVGQDARTSPDINFDLWSKYIFLTTLAGITCLMRADIGTVMACGNGADLTRQLFKECLSVARKEGYVPDAETMKSYLTLLTEAGSNLTSSMLRDIEKGRKTEWDHILGDMLNRARLHKLDTPILAICTAHVECFEKRLGQMD